MIGTEPLGPMLHSFFIDHLITVKGLRPASVRSYRDTIRLFLQFAAADKHCKITRLALGDHPFDRVVGFLKHLEATVVTTCVRATNAWPPYTASSSTSPGEHPKCWSSASA
jgi:hypothetical protein